MDENIGTLLSQVSRLLRRSFDERARDIGVTRPQWQVLAILNSNAGIKQGGLAEILEVEPITAGRMIDRLQEAGLVERRADPTDRRAWRLYLTGRGEAQLNDLKPFALETFEMLLEGIGEADREKLLALLMQMRSNLITPAKERADG